MHASRSIGSFSRRPSLISTHNPLDIIEADLVAPTQSWVVRVEAWFAIVAAFSSVPPRRPSRHSDADPGLAGAVTAGVGLLDCN
jgi:hypothetical protein